MSARHESTMDHSASVGKGLLSSRLQYIQPLRPMTCFFHLEPHRTCQLERKKEYQSPSQGNSQMGPVGWVVIGHPQTPESLTQPFLRSTSPVRAASERLAGKCRVYGRYPAGLRTAVVQVSSGHLEFFVLPADVAVGQFKDNAKYEIEHVLKCNE